MRVTERYGLLNMMHLYAIITMDVAIIYIVAQVNALVRICILFIYFYF